MFSFAWTFTSKCFDKFHNESLEEYSVAAFREWQECFDEWWEATLFDKLFEVDGLKGVGSRYCKFKLLFSVL